MTPDDLQALIDGGETLSVEFKRATAGAINDREVVEAAVCLANGPGGHLLLGVEDNGRVTGAHPRHRDRTDPSRMVGLILNLTDPHLATEVEIVQLAGLDVIVITVPRAPSGPVGTRDGVFKRRSLKPDGTPECIPYRPSEMLSAGLDLAGVDYATIAASGATMLDLDPGEFDRFRRLCSSGRGDASLANLDDVDVLRALRLDAGDAGTPRPSLGAVLLFGTAAARERWTPTAECLFQDFRSSHATVNETLRQPLFAAAETLEERIQLRNVATELMVGMHRVDLPLLASSTVREAVANALVHRSYADLGPVVVQFADDALTISSPGGLPAGITLDNLLEQSRPRSVALAEAFKRAGLVDRRGKGINEMFASQLRAGRDAPDYSKTTTASVSVTIPTGHSDLDVVRFILAYEDKAQAPLSLDDLRVLHQLRAVGPSAASELADDLHLTAGVARSLAHRLVERGLIEARGHGRNRRFHLTAGFYALAEDRNAYIRVQGIDQLQREQMITEYVRRYGKITRSQAAALVQLSPEAASRILRTMTQQGLLAMRGERRSAHYVLGHLDT